MSTIFWTRSVAFIIIYVHSFNFFVALAAPISVTPETTSLLRKRVPSHDSGLYTRWNVHARDNKPVPVSLVHAPVAPYSSGRNPAQSPYARILKASAAAPKEPEFQTLVRRSIFTKIKDAFQKAGSAIKSGFQKMGNGIKSGFQKMASGIKNVAQKVGSGIKNVAQKVGNGIKSVAQKVGSGIKSVAQKVGSGIKSVAQKVGNGIKNVAQKVGNGVKTAVKVVGNGLKTAGKWVKENGAKIAKAGLKIISTVGSVVGRVASFIPGVGKVVSKGLKYASAGLDKASDAIHANLGGFGKAMNVMDKIEHPLSGVGGQVLDNVLG